MEHEDNEQSNPYFWIDIVFDICICGISFVLLYFFT